MKAINTFLKVLTVLASIAGVLYVIAVYGDKIVAWVKKLLGHCPCVVTYDDLEDDFAFDEEVPSAAEVPSTEAPAEEPATEEVPVNEAEPVAEENDFEG